MYKIEEIVNDPIALSLWLDSKQERISPVCAPLLDNPTFVIPASKLPKPSKEKGRVLTEIKFPDWIITKSLTQESHGVLRVSTGSWIYPNIARDIERLNPGLRLTKDDIVATFKHHKILLKNIKPQEIDPRLVKDFEGTLEKLLHTLFINPDTLTWTDLLPIVTNPMIKQAIEETGTLMLKQIYTLTKEPEYYINYANSLIFKETELTDEDLYILGQYAPTYAQTGESHEPYKTEIDTLLTDPRFYIKDKPSSLLVGMQLYKNHQTLINVKPYIQSIFK